MANGTGADTDIYKTRLETAMQAGNVAWWEMQLPSGEIRFHDRKAEVLGYDPKNFDHYEDFTSLIHPEDHDRAMSAMRDHLDGEADRYDVEYRIETAEGPYHWFHDVGSITERHEDGDPHIVSGIVIDITKRKEYAAEIDRRNRQLTLLNRIVRHDIRNDIALAIGYLDILEEDIPEEVTREFEKIRTATEHILKTTKDIKSVISVLGDDETSLDGETVVLSTIVSQEVTALRNSHTDAIIEVNDVPDVPVRGNELLSSVVKNLVENAIEHNPKETPTVQIEGAVNNDTVTLTVADNGPGIPDTIKSEIFDSGVSDSDSGLGLGLFIVEKLVRAFDGEISVTDNEPEGTVFSVTLQRE